MSPLACEVEGTRPRGQRQPGPEPTSLLPARSPPRPSPCPRGGGARPAGSTERWDPVREEVCRHLTPRFCPVVAVTWHNWQEMRPPANDWAGLDVVPSLAAFLLAIGWPGQKGPSVTYSWGGPSPASRGGESASGSSRVVHRNPYSVAGKKLFRTTRKRPA